MKRTDVDWRALPFDRLSARDLHDLLRLRQSVFIVEQNCVFAEIDGRDPLATHLLGHRDGILVACARMFAPGIVGAEASIGRVVTDRSVRGTGLGRPLMLEALRALEAIAPGAAVRLAAQAHLERFYASIGFERVGEAYLEDGMLHLDMVRPARVSPTGG